MTTPFYVTTPIYYCNDEPHIGHSYTTVICDTLARYHRLMGDPTRFLTGTDEHGQKVDQAAAKAGKTPKAFVDEVSQTFSRLWTDMGMSHDRCIRTTDEDHHRVVAELWRRMQAHGDIYLGDYEDWYCVPCETYWTEKQLLEGECCPNPWCKRKVEKRKEQSYFFKLSAYTQPLLDFYKAHPDFVLPATRMNEVTSFVSQGLNDLSISRTSFRWGIPVPGDDRHVVYVWVDALANYLTGTGFLTNPEQFDTFWPHAVHLIGKDILRFHAVFWPAFLMSAGLPLPQHVVAHGFWTVDGQKMSKSLGNVVRPREMMDTYGLDAFRYFLLREVSLGPDGDFSRTALVNRVNAELANDVGNLLSRSVAMAEKYLGGVLPAVTDGTSPLAQVCLAAEARYHAGFAALQPQAALEAALEIAGRANKYIDECAPWALAKQPEKHDELAALMYDLCESLRRLALLLTPFIPGKTGAMLEQLGQDIDPARHTLGTWGGLPAGTHVRKGPALFPRIEEKPVETAPKPAETPVPAAPAPAAPVAPAPEAPEGVALIEYDDFAKLTLRTGTVLAAEKVEGADKLLKLRVDTGSERTIVAGIAKHYTAEEMVGKTIIVLVNLKPRKLRGIVSEGMLLAATAADGHLRVLTTDGPMPSAARVG